MNAPMAIDGQRDELVAPRGRDLAVLAIPDVDETRSPQWRERIAEFQGRRDRHAERTVRQKMLEKVDLDASEFSKRRDDHQNGNR